MTTLFRNKATRPLAVQMSRILNNNVSEKEETVSFIWLEKKPTAILHQYLPCDRLQWTEHEEEDDDCIICY